MKKLCLIDMNAEYIQYIPTDKYKIEILITGNTGNIEQFRKKYGDSISVYYDVRDCFKNFNQTHKNNYNLTYAQIEKFRPTQLKVEHGLQRKYSDMGYIQSIYFQALSYWLNIFQIYDIDVLFVTAFNHASIYDCIPIDIAISKNIPTYNIVSVSVYDKTSILQVILLNQKKFIKLSPQNTFDTQHFINNLQLYYKTYFFKNKKANFQHPYKFLFKNQIKTFPYYCLNIFRSHKRAYNKDYFLDKHEVFTSASYVKKLKKLYDKISENPSLEEKFIYYPLHQEPEASIMARTTLVSQLLIIKWLSQSLPKGWKLYIKEHLSQFFSYEQNSYFLKNIHCFRSPQFYKQIKLLPNTCLVNINTPSNLLIQKSMGVASIAGSSLLESCLLHKPIIIFGEGVTFLELLQDSFNITSKSSLTDAINKIVERGGVYSLFGFYKDYLSIRHFERLQKYRKIIYKYSVE